MLFSRPNNDGTNETYYSLVRKPPIITSALALSVTATTLLSATSGRSRPVHRSVSSHQKSLRSGKVPGTVTKISEQKLTGVWGWTTGSQTYLRVRPSAEVPAVAKVPRGTKLFVWGTYNGWYRVEMTNHVFGWVFHPYIHAPDAERLRELSHRKAKIASDRAASQIMYGSSDVLLRYYAQYGAPGARRGLRKHGIKLAAAKPKSTLKTVTVTAPRPRTPARLAAATIVKAPARISAPPKVAPKPVQAARRTKAAKPSWRTVAWKRRQLRIQRERERLRRQMGTPVMAAPPLSSPQLPPISPQELMSARDAYVASRNRNVTTAMQPGTPGAATRANGGLSTDNALLRPSSFTASRSRTPGAKVQINRGGSPRDYLKQSAQPSPFNRGLVNQALSYRGMPYIRGAESPRRGFDCSGLVYFLLRQRGYNPPRTAAGYKHYGQTVTKDKLKPGDILLFANTNKRGISHMGIYMGNGRFVHAANPGKGVRTDSFTSGYYGHRYYGARRVPSR